jgi:hypothetical protein
VITIDPAVCPKHVDGLCHCTMTCNHFPIALLGALEDGEALIVINFGAWENMATESDQLDFGPLAGRCLETISHRPWSSRLSS